MTLQEFIEASIALAAYRVLNLHDTRVKRHDLARKLEAMTTRYADTPPKRRKTCRTGHITTRNIGAIFALS